MSRKLIKSGVILVVVFVAGWMAASLVGGCAGAGGADGVDGIVPTAGAQFGSDGGEAGMFEVDTRPKTDAEKKILQVAREVGATAPDNMWNAPEEDTRMLRVLTESIDAQHVVEIGTSNGYSGLWICMALENTGGKLTTYEIREERVKLARENFEKAGVSDHVTVVHGNAHEEVTKLDGQIDLLFLDADKQGYVDYLQKLLPQVRPGGLIVAHNMTEGMADPDYVEAITENPKLETFFVHEPGGGMGVTVKKR